LFLFVLHALQSLMMATASADGLVGAVFPVNCALIARFHDDGTRLLPNDGSKWTQTRAQIKLRTR
jgi:hypothetical protein